MPRFEHPAFEGGLGPYEDESAVGFTFRAARRLPEYRSGADLGGACGMAGTNRPTKAALDRLASVTETDPDLLEFMSYGLAGWLHYHFHGVILPQAMSPDEFANTSRVCPGCLSEKPYQRGIWDLRFISACPVHSTQLVSHCFSCGSALRWYGKSITRCRCLRSADLASVVADRVTADDIKATKVVHGLLRDARFASEGAWVRTLPPFTDLLDSQIIEFLFRTGLEMLGARKMVFSFSNLGEHALAAHLALAHGLRAAEGWPGGFFHVIDTMRRRSADSSAWTLDKCVGPMDRWAEKVGRNRGRRLRAALSDYRARQS